ncbi:GTP-binding protein At2g22870-like [Glycine soja]|uniref:GTP-binding protein At2g22870-like n=1 Tax=Glycine soja TaxID=3848 RepID=UPI00103D2521|nr:GTP-binding protein At2g22870-like [Glycine soja]
MVLFHLPRFPLYLVALSPSLTLRAYSKTTFLRPPKSTLTASKSVTVNPSPTELSPEKLFVPPETTVSLESSRVLNGFNILLSNYANDAQVLQAEFVKSSVKIEDCPFDGLPEFAIVGRSNVGKSLLLNSLVCRKKLALISKKPG